jgi:glycine cleavage system H lipoate-binding protein
VSGGPSSAGAAAAAGGPCSDGTAAAPAQAQAQVAALAPAAALTVTRVEFVNVSAPRGHGGSLTAMTVTGKRKKGALFVEADTVLAVVHTAGGAAFPVRAGVRGMVLEVNKRLLEEPGLVASAPAGAGYVAVLDVKLHRVLEMQAGLLSRDQYEALAALRGLPSRSAALSRPLPASMARLPLPVLAPAVGESSRVAAALAPVGGGAAAEAGHDDEASMTAGAGRP